jgi:hypothetical protein
MALAATPSATLRLVHSDEAPVDHKQTRIAFALLAAAAANCAFQIFWFWRLTSRNINYDAISYIGIARHVAHGDFGGSLNGYWSPLVSWIVALLSGFSIDFTLLARLVTIASFIVCLPLVYRLTHSLWHSHVLAASAVLWFTLARGIVSFSVYFIGADFLLTAFVLGYFTVLLRGLRDPSAGSWVALGTFHGLAFLAKAISFPWLMISTLLACGLAARKKVGVVALRAIAALSIPLMIWSGWGLALKTKYGVFTPGYQSKWNLLDERSRDAGLQPLSVLHDTSKNFGADMVVDNMPPGSPLWHTKVPPSGTIRLLLERERVNLPQAVRELILLMTPGGLLAIILAVTVIGRNCRPEARFLWIVLASVASLITGYCMLVFDERYLYPIVPLLVAIGVAFIAPARTAGVAPNRFPHLRVMALVLLAASTAFLFLYHASPFRSLRRDFQSSCYDAARKLRAGDCGRLVVMGAGPYPEHGVGWEAGIYASYFASCRMVAFTPELPAANDAARVEGDLRTVNPDAVLVFGSAGEGKFESSISAVRNALSDPDTEPVNDPAEGVVGMLLRTRTGPSVAIDVVR